MDTIYQMLQDDLRRTKNRLRELEDWQAGMVVTSGFIVASLDRPDGYLEQREQSRAFDQGASFADGLVREIRKQSQTVIVRRNTNPAPRSTDSDLDSSCGP